MTAEIRFTHENDQVTTFSKTENGAWKADGIQALSPMKMLEHLALYVDLTYREEPE